VSGGDPTAGNDNGDRNLGRELAALRRAHCELVACVRRLEPFDFLAACELARAASLLIQYDRGLLPASSTRAA
jgi:hypothetical protein